MDPLQENEWIKDIKMISTTFSRSACRELLQISPRRKNLQGISNG